MNNRAAAAEKNAARMENALVLAALFVFVRPSSLDWTACETTNKDISSGSSLTVEDATFDCSYIGVVASTTSSLVDCFKRVFD